MRPTSLYISLLYIVLLYIVLVVVVGPPIVAYPPRLRPIYAAARLRPICRPGMRKSHQSPQSDLHVARREAIIMAFPVDYSNILMDYSGIFSRL